MKNLRTGIEIKELKPIKKGTKIAEYIKPLLKDPKVVAKQLGIDYDDFLEKQELATEKMEALKKFLIQKIQSDCGAAIIKKGTIISDPDTILNDPKLTRQLIKYFNLSPPKLNKNSDNYSEFVLNPESQNPISVNDLAIIMEHFTNDADLTLERNIILILLEFKKTFLKIFLSRETLLNNRERVFKAWEIIYSLTVKSPVICNDMLFSPKIIKKNNDELDSLGEILEQQNKKKIRDLINEEFPQDKKEFVKNHYMLAIRLISLYPQLLNEHEKKFCFMSFNYLLFRESQSAIFFTNLLGGSAFWKFFKDWCGKNITILDEHSSTLPAIFSFLSTWEKSNKRTSIPAYIEKIFENPQAYFRIKKQKKTTSRKTRKTIQPPKKLTPTATPQTPNKTSKPEKEPFITPNIKLLDSERLTFNIKNLPEAQNKNENVSLWGRVCKAPNRFEIKPDKNGKFSYPGSLKRNKENTLCFRFAPNENSPNTEYPEIKINISKIIKKKPDTTAPWEPPEKTPPVAIHTKIGKTSADVAFITSPPKKASLDERQEHEELLQMALEHFGPLLENADLEEDRISVNISIDDLLDVITKEDITYIEEHLAYISFKENRLSIDLKHDTESEDLETFINNIYKKLLIKKKTIDEEQSEINKWRSQLKRNECSAELIQNQRKFNRASRQPDTSKKGWYRERNNKTGYWWELIWESNKEGYFNRLKILKDELQKKAGIILSIDKQSKTFPQPFKIQIPIMTIKGLSFGQNSENLEK
ncbi:MAG: hypothetical protein OEL89_00585 [Candidatus Peregrinibacteria bacterium]|nr:hypothetical protein [Candidatus Peregrinibacteria bacterium]